MLTNDGLLIDFCPVDRIPELQTFIDEYWKKGHILSRDRELLRWQYNFPGNDDRISVLTARQEDALTGILGVIHSRFCCWGESLSAGWLAMWMAPPQQRRQLVGLKLLQRVLSGEYSVVGTLGFNVKTIGVYEALRFDIRDSIPRWIRLGSRGSAEQILGERSSLYDSKLWGGVRGTRDDTLPGSPYVILDWNAENAKRWDSAWTELFAPRILGNWRDADYLRWRYVDHPSFRYVMQFAEDPISGSLVGLLVYRIETVLGLDAKVLRVLEFLSVGEAGKALARVVVEVSESEDVAFSDFYCTSQVFAAPLEDAGFIPEDNLEAPLPSRFQPLDWQTIVLNSTFWASSKISQSSSSFFQTDDLYVTRSDGDQDRPN